MLRPPSRGSYRTDGQPGIHGTDMGSGIRGMHHVPVGKSIFKDVAISSRMLSPRLPSTRYRHISGKLSSQLHDPYAHNSRIQQWTRNMDEEI